MVSYLWMKMIAIVSQITEMPVPIQCCVPRRVRDIK